jgi:glycosyltransferase involved in cell wall biosynthesis
LHQAGFQVDIQPLVDDEYLERLFTGRRSSPVYLLSRMVKRLGRLTKARRYDLVFIEREVFPHWPGFAEALLDTFGVPYVLDIDDAIFLPYENARSWLKRRLLAGKLRAITRRAALVLAGSTYLKNYAERSAKNVALFPTVVDADRFTPTVDKQEQAPPVIGWIGSPSTVHFLKQIAPVLQRVAKHEPFRLTVVGAEKFAVEGVEVVGRPWSEETETDDLRRFDIGIMPLDDSEWSKGKCSLKLLQYMGTGVPSVASHTASAPEIISDGVNGFLARNTEEWEEKLVALLRSPELRRNVGAEARKWIEANYCLANYGLRFVEHLKTAAGKP